MDYQICLFGLLFFSSDLLNFGKLKMSRGGNKDESSNGKQVTCLVVGAGNRGFGYAFFAVAFPQQFKVMQTFLCIFSDTNQVLK